MGLTFWCKNNLQVQSLPQTTPLRQPFRTTSLYTARRYLEIWNIVHPQATLHNGHLPSHFRRHLAQQLPHLVRVQLNCKPHSTPLPMNIHVLSSEAFDKPEASLAVLRICIATSDQVVAFTLTSGSSRHYAMQFRVRHAQHCNLHAPTAPRLSRELLLVRTRGNPLLTLPTNLYLVSTAL